jgi:hypothetical protein
MQGSGAPDVGKLGRCAMRLLPKGDETQGRFAAHSMAAVILDSKAVLDERSRNGVTDTNRARPRRTGGHPGE